MTQCMPDQDQAPPRHHLLIAGTGRAGTSFLVRWLAAMGLQTHLATHDTPDWNEDANAGLEDLPMVADFDAAPYVMKSPWLVEVIDDVLANPRIVLDAVIIPVRDLAEAATSRVVQELHTAHRRNPWMSGLSRSFEQWGITPGGVVYSLEPMDQARLLAVSFHRLVQRLVTADIPFVPLDFPRLALDADYLYGKLRRFVPDGASPEQARAAHAEIADPEKIRIGRELAAVQIAGTDADGRGMHDRIDVLALRREVRRLTDALAASEQAAAAEHAAVAALRGAVDAQGAETSRLVDALAARDTDLKADALSDTAEQGRAAAAQAAQREMETGLRTALAAQGADLAALATTLELRDAELQTARAEIASMIAVGAQEKAEAERRAAEQREAIADLRGDLAAQGAELTGLATILHARDAELQAAEARNAALDAVAAQLRAERHIILTSRIWRAGEPLRRAGRTAKTLMAALRQVR